MLPSMPILFTRESQDAFGNKIEPNTSFFNQNTSKPAIIIQPQENISEPGPSKVQTEVKTEAQKKEEQSKQNNALEEALVRSYYTKVQSRFSSNSMVPDNKFVQFREILKTFDPMKETPVDLYRKVESLLGEEHKDIVEEFLLFLKPGQASQVGRFMDHFMQTQIMNFIELLQKSFARKPTVLRKVLGAITAGVNKGRGAEMKARVLRHLRSSPRLANMFRSLFPDERPPDSVYETGTDVMSESFLTADAGYDVWELDEPAAERPRDANAGLDAVYLHGRVFLQHGRMLRTACVTYPYSKEPYRAHVRRLAPIHCRLSPPQSDDDTETKRPNKQSNTSKIPKRTKKQIKSSTKQVKDVNDNTKHKNCLPQTPKTVRCRKPKNKERKDEKTETQRNKKVQESKRVKEVSQTDEVLKKNCTSKVKHVKIEPLTEVKIEAGRVERSWTREEDKTMLEVLKGEAGSEQVFRRISELLPHRSASEIKERFCYVMNLLQQMEVIKVT